jgi:hypothetical protein
MQTLFLLTLALGVRTTMSLAVMPNDQHQGVSEFGPLPSGMLEQVTSGMAHRQHSILEPKQFLSMIRKYTFEDFVKGFRRPYKRGTLEWKAREQVFNENKMTIIDFHLAPRRSWRLGVTDFMDHTPEEFKRLLGYKPSRSSRGQGAIRSPTISVVRTQAVVETVVNATGPGMSGLIRNQGACGSCWAMAAASTLEAHVERNNDIMMELNKLVTAADGFPSLSSQTILSCTSNPRHCGGKGGCDGATVQLAYDMIKEKGIPLSKHWNYLAEDEPCKSGVFEKAVVGITHYDELPKNQLEPLKRAIVTHGPVAVAVAASEWSFYIDGVMSDRDAPDSSKFLLNHAVVAIGFNAAMSGKTGSVMLNGVEPQLNYWLIKNSWGREWGEHGNVRIEMKSDEARHCGWDEDTHVGMACDGDSNRDWACGTFGILYNGVLPKGVHLKQ